MAFEIFFAIFSKLCNLDNFWIYFLLILRRGKICKLFVNTASSREIKKSPIPKKIGSFCQMILLHLCENGFRAVGKDYSSVIHYYDRFKTAVGAVIIKRALLSKEKKRGRKGIRPHTVLAQNRDL